MNKFKASIGAAFGWPQGLNREESSVYVGTGTSLFDEMVNDGRMPKAKKANTRKIWYRPALDMAIANLPTEEEAKKPNGFDELLGEGK
ncbi:MAG: hypothetical protein O2817_11465 [Proteobacteria bacterium]|nr:hypothetical protein [Pseudomonadota bacterium]